MRRCLVGPPFLLLLTATTVSAQSAFSGLVRDTSGAVLPGVTVEATSPVLIEKTRTGYRQANAMQLDWASYGAASGSGELPKTRGTAKLRLVHRDHQKQFIPVWVGLPEVKYQVQFRIVDPRTGVVQGMASTGAMRGERHRYSCAPKT